MKFEATDYDWTDWHQGLSSQRIQRYGKVVEAIYAKLLEILCKYHGTITMQASVPLGIFAKGIRGDGPMYAPIVILQAHRIPSYARLHKISQEITNTLPVSHVIYRLDGHLPKDVIGAMKKEGKEILLQKAR